MEAIMSYVLRRIIMQKHFFTALMIGVVFFYLGSCASEQARRVVEPAPELEPVVEAEKEAPTKKVVEEVQLIAKELSYYWDGVLASYRVYKYADEGTQRLEEVLYNSDDEVQERIVYKYEEGNRRGMQTFDESGKLQSYHTYRYDSRNLLVEDSFFDAEDELQTRQEYKYDEGGRKTRWEVYNGDLVLLSNTLYTYEDGLNTLIENYSPSGEVLDFFTIEYNSMGDPIKRTWYSDEDQVKESKGYTYEDGVLTEETIFRGNGSVLREIRYSNNSSGSPVEKLILDGGGDIQEQITFEYINRTRVKYVRVDD